ncbi:MAG: DUF58 domain-containing protein [Aquificaceae bacterium]|nr:DUF58 domain-containing protein [Aquificaceae bacterium]
MKVRYKVRVNRAGVIFIGISVFLGIAAVTTANNLLYLVVSYLLSFMLLSGVFSLYNIKGLEVVPFLPEEVYAGAEVPLRIKLKNHKRLPAFLVEVKCNGGAGTFAVISREGEDTLRVVFDTRGAHQGFLVEVTSSFPVGLFERFCILEVPLKFVVFPRLLPCQDALRRLTGGKGEQASSKSRKRGYEELQGIKEYSNEPIRLVHWKLSAKTGELYVKDMTEESAPPLFLSLEDVEGTLEERISKLACLVVKLTARGHPVGLKLPTKTIEPATGTQHKRYLLTELALL